jgi:hypothetical protein
VTKSEELLFSLRRQWLESKSASNLFSVSKWMSKHDWDVLSEISHVEDFRAGVNVLNDKTKHGFCFVFQGKNSFIENKTTPKKKQN